MSFDVLFGVPFDPVFLPRLEALWFSICTTNRLHLKNLTHLFAVLIPYTFRDRTFYHFYLLHFIIGNADCFAGHHLAFLTFSWVGLPTQTV